MEAATSANQRNVKETNTLISRKRLTAVLRIYPVVSCRVPQLSAKEVEIIT
ncbi:hypothetical protein HFO97_27845 [Rhizobium leguminosarum]|nr:hypothetical protein [Rhizobium leguminosarum]